ncbi:hypothetical protein [Agromyces sp. Root81]|nr:hypothetical protein [Agromyces sp. Root81]
MTNPETPAFAPRLVHFGPDEYTGLDCGDFIIATQSGGTHAWPDGR